MTLPPGIAELREFAQERMLEPTQVQRLVTTEVEPGYPRTSWETIANTNSFARPVGQRELLRAQQAGIEVESRRFLPIGTDVTEEDVLVVDSQQWSITGIPEKTEELSSTVEVYLRRRT